MNTDSAPRYTHVSSEHIEIHASRSRYGPAIELYIFRGPSTALDGNGVFQEYPENGIPPRAGMLDQNAAQQLADDLYAAEIRPTEAAGSAGALSATQRHLDDMRKLVFEAAKPQSVSRPVTVPQMP